MLQLSHQLIAPHVTSKLDQHALSFLEDIELKQDVNDFRPYELVFVRPSPFLPLDFSYLHLGITMLIFFFFSLDSTLRRTHTLPTRRFLKNTHSKRVSNLLPLTVPSLTSSANSTRSRISKSTYVEFFQKMLFLLYLTDFGHSL